METFAPRSTDPSARRNTKCLSEIPFNICTLGSGLPCVAFWVSLGLSYSIVCSSGRAISLHGGTCVEPHTWDRRGVYQ